MANSSPASSKTPPTHPDVVKAAVEEIVARGHDRRCWLIFCSGVRHAQHVAEALREHGIAVATMTAETPSNERDRRYRRFPCRHTARAYERQRVDHGLQRAADRFARHAAADTLDRALCANDRSRHAQGGRQVRLSRPRFCRQCFSPGPVDRTDIHIENRKAGVKTDTVAARVCPGCGELNALRAAECVSCGHEFPAPNPKPKHAGTADWMPIMGGPSDWMAVDSVNYRLHVKFSDPSAPPSLRVEYSVGSCPTSEWISLQRTGYAREMAERLVVRHGRAHRALVEQALARTGELDTVCAITVVREGKYWRVHERRVRRANGEEVDLNRYFRVRIAGSRVPVPAMNDEIPY